MWGILGVAVFVLVGWLLLWWFDAPNRKRFRQYDDQLAAREPLPDAEWVARYFNTDEVFLEVPPKVRRVFAEHMDYPAEKLLPDDDFAFFWADSDMVDLIEELESGFNIVISKSDTERTPCTIRAVSLLVGSKMRPSSAGRKKA